MDGVLITNAILIPYSSYSQYVAIAPSILPKLFDISTQLPYNYVYGPF